MSWQTGRYVRDTSLAAVMTNRERVAISLLR